MENHLYQTPDYYDAHGNSKSHKIFWLCCLFLARAWIVFIIAGVSQDQGTALLELFYQHKQALYIALGLGTPSAFLMLIAGNLHHYPRFLSHIWRYGKIILLTSLSADLTLQLLQMNAMNWRFHWSNAITLLLSTWLLFYLIKSRRMQFLFKSPIVRNEK